VDMFTATLRIKALERYAERTLEPRSAKAVKERCEGLLAVVAAGGGRMDLYDEVVALRAAEGFPGTFKAWAWFDNRLLALADYLVEPETFPTQSELVQRLEDACLTGVLQ
jgi:hypothetical protein